MLAVIATQWKWLLVRGLIAGALGVLVLLWPTVPWDGLVAAMEAYLLLNGGAAMMMAIRASGRAGSRTILAEGVASAAAGSCVLIFPDAWPRIIAAWAILTGTALIVAAATRRPSLKGEWPFPVGGALSLIAATLLALGLLLARLRDQDMPVVVWTVALYGIFSGVAQTALAIRARERLEEGTPHA
jgi:uncharacterized membrane protein HdeD (DUF308 family)